MTSPSDLRQAFGQFGTGVAIIAFHDHESRPVGITVNSFASVSLEPPLLSWCLDNNSHLHPDVAAIERFSVNILAADQLDLSNRMAGAGSHILAADEFEAGTADTPLLRGALAQFDCHIHHKVEVGDHIMLIGGIDKAAHCPLNRAPLMYFRGTYVGLELEPQNG